MEQGVPTRQTGMAILRSVTLVSAVVPGIGRVAGRSLLRVCNLHGWIDTATGFSRLLPTEVTWRRRNSMLVW